MPDYSTLSELLAAQSETRLRKLRVSILAEIQRLGLELKLIEDALNRKGRSRAASVPPPARSEEPRNTHVVKTATTVPNGGLSRDDLLEYVREIGHPTTPAEVRDVLAAKGILRRIEATRVALSRLQKSGALTRDDEGRYAVPSSNGDGAKVEPADPLFRGSGLDTEGVATPDE